MDSNYDKALSMYMGLLSDLGRRLDSTFHIGTSAYKARISACADESGDNQFNIRVAVWELDKFEEGDPLGQRARPRTFSFTVKMEEERPAGVQDEFCADDDVAARLTEANDE